MRIWDCHCHCRGDETGEEVLRQMDKAGVDRINLFGKYPGKRGASEFRREDVRAAIDHIAAVQAADPERIFGLLWAEPRAPGMVEEIEYGIVDKGLRGVKMIPDHWEPCDPMLFPIYAKMEELGKPIQFHSGILYGFGDSSRFCRPVLYEALVHFPRLRFSLAHISWPWVDECIAVFGRFRAAAGYKLDGCQMWIDTCRGTPDAWREEALRKAIPFCGMGRLMFGVDASPANLAQTAPVHIQKDLALLRNVIGVSEQQVETFFWGACASFYGVAE
ncbi:MAG: amidohydrolase family protein, partial [Armatimonadota bacterium]|nr:amidohydrolase family protein [Armatimonadota bacterium]